MLKQVDKVNFRIVKPLGTLSYNGNITTELNVISYNNYKPKLDLRKWEQKGENKIMQRGLTLTDAEARELKKNLDAYLEDLDNRIEKKLLEETNEPKEA